MAGANRPSGPHASRAILAWAALLLLTASLVIASGLVSAIRAADPGAALRIMPTDALALAGRADQLLLAHPGDRATMGNVRAAARAALAHDATRVTAWRALASTLPDGSTDAPRLLDVAQWLSRRDALTQLALLQYDVQRGDVVGALAHYDTVLRTTSNYDALLFPVLASASAQSSVRPSLARRLIEAGLWRRRFLSYMAAAGTPATTQADLYAAMARLGPLADRDIAATQATHAALGGQYAEGERLYRLTVPGGTLKPLRDGAFDRDGGTPPYDWALDADGPLDVAINTYEGQRRLEMVSERGDGARGARQLITFSPGRHHLHAAEGAIDDIAAATPYAAVTCAPDGKPLATVEARAGTGLDGDFVVPSGCYPQWLELGLRQDAGGGRTGAWIDAVTIR